MLRQVLIWFMILSASIAASEEVTRTTHTMSLTEVEGDPSALVAGCVNIITGSYNESEVDIVLPGPEPLAFQRFYNSYNQENDFLFCNWTYNHTPNAKIDSMGSQYVFVVPETNGGALIYRGGGLEKRKNGPYERVVPQKKVMWPHQDPGQFRGMTNTAGGEISGRSNLRNQAVWYDNASAHLYTDLCDGCGKLFVPTAPWKLQQDLPVEFVLRQERRRNGNTIFYDYRDHVVNKLEKGGKDKRRLLENIRYTDHLGNRNLNCLSFDYSGVYLGKPDQYIKLVADDGREVQYRLKRYTYRPEQNRHHHFYLEEVIRPNGPKIQYGYYHYGTWREGRIQNKIVGDRLKRHVVYYHSGKNHVGNSTIETAVGDHRNHRVFQLHTPAGVDEDVVLTHTFTYGEKFGDVYDAYSHRVGYAWDDEQRLERIVRYAGNKAYTPYRTDCFFWGQKGSTLETNLVCKALLEANGLVRSCRYLEYDSKSNVTAEHTLGNLSGICNIYPSISNKDVPDSNGCEDYVIRRTYTQDRYNRLASEVLPNGRITEIEYCSDTHLITSKLTKDNSRILGREFFEYNHYGVPIKTIQDNGRGHSPDDLAGVTCRKITYITTRDSTPCFGLPEVIEERYLDIPTGTEKLLNKKILTYTREGWIAGEDHYDANNELRFSLCRDFDYMGNCILEQDALGRITTRRFDTFGNKIYEQGHDSSFHFTYLYDASDRLIAEERVCQDGHRFKKAYRYDYNGNKIAYVDIFGQKTTYCYDEFNRVIETIFPSFVDATGNIVVLSSKQEYDIANNVVAITDVDGNVIRKKYNIRRQETEVSYPDGSIERSVYNLDGTLRQQTAVNGLTTKLSYDVLGNCIRKDTYSAAGDLLSSTSAVYCGELLISETDANGNITSYYHDGAGRPIKIVKPHNTTCYEYDSLGRKSKTIEFFGKSADDVRITSVDYDVLSHVLEERLEDSRGNILTRTIYAYDVNGERTHVTTFGQSGPSTTITSFNSQGQVCKVVDAEGHETLTYYDYDSRNAQKQRILQITVVNPLGDQVVTTYDTLGRAEAIIHKDSYGEVIAQTINAFDAKGHVVKRTDTVKAEGKPDYNVVTEWRYDALGRVVELIEGSGTRQCRNTCYTFNKYGQKDCDILPGGITLNYSYDAFGRLARYEGSDLSFAYIYRYDPQGNLLEVHDEITDTATLRAYDSASRLISETLANGLSIGYRYDGIGRITHVDLPDQSGVENIYGAGFLRTIKRMDAKGVTTYSHNFLSYDQAGQIIEAEMIGSTGIISYQRDKLSRVRFIQSNHFQESIPENGFDAAGNLLVKTRRDTLGEVNCQYTYDKRHQLISESGIANHRYRYDSLDNRLSIDDQECELDALNQMVSQGSACFTYDAQGNRISKTQDDITTHYAYDAIGRLTEIANNEQRILYCYDAFNRRISKQIIQHNGDSRDERYLYQDQMDIGTVDAKGEIIQLRTLGKGLGAEIGAAIAIEMANKIFAPLHDHSGHVVALVNAESGEVAEAYRYSAFGDERCYKLKVTEGVWWSKLLRCGPKQEWTSDGYEPVNPWRFSSKRCDPETGFVNFGRRYYDPITGRWLTPDPIGYSDGPNLYNYVHNRPITHYDLYGLWTQRNQGGGWSWSPGEFCRTVVNSVCSTFSTLVGRGMSHCPVFEQMTMRERPSYNYEPIGMRNLAYGCIGVINGMSNLYKDACGMANYISTLASDGLVHLTHNSSSCKLVDFMECILGLMGFTTEPVRKLHEKWSNMLDAKETHLEICHSQGAIHVRNALMTYPKELRDRILVLAVAPGAYIPEEYCRQVAHLRNSNPLRDPTPRFDWLGALRCKGTITDLPTHKDVRGLFDHSFTSPTYQEAIQYHISRYEKFRGQKI